MNEKDNQEAERAAFEAWYVKEAGLSRKFMLSQNSDGSYAYEETECMWEAWQGSAARRSPAVGDDGLPPLPAPVDTLAAEDGFGVVGTQDVYTAEQYRQGQRDAVAADRATWQDRIYQRGRLAAIADYQDIVADLRAQLALKSQEGT